MTVFPPKLRLRALLIPVLLILLFCWIINIHQGAVNAGQVAPIATGTQQHFQAVKNQDAGPGDDSESTDDEDADDEDDEWEA